MILKKETENAKSLINGFYRYLWKQIKWVDHIILKNSNGTYGPTVFEVRMREIDLAVDCSIALVFCAPKHKWLSKSNGTLIDHMNQMDLWKKWIWIEIATKKFCFAIKPLEPENFQHLKIHVQCTGVWLLLLTKLQIKWSISWNSWQNSLFVCFGGPEKGRLVRVRWADESA